MGNVTEHFIKGSDNQIKLILTEDGSAISGAWTRLEVWIGDLEIERTTDENGIALNTSTGELTITPADLTEDLSSLVVNRLYRVLIVLVDATNDDGALFGGNDSTDRLYFLVSELPS